MGFIRIIIFFMGISLNAAVIGHEYPQVGFGTYPFQGKECLNAVKEAADLGYRIIDTATFYENFVPIGKALKKANREEFYLISKVWPDRHTPKLLRKDLKKTLKELKIGYLDAYLLHWPNSKVSIVDALREMESLRNEGLIRHIGLSNVTVNHLRRALEVGVAISWVQVEMNPFFYDADLLEFCKEKGIGVQAWAPLARGRLLDDALLLEIGRKYGKTPAQVAIRWILQHGGVPLPASKNPTHIRENQDVHDFALNAEEMSLIDERAKHGKRERVTEEYGLGFTDEFDFSYEECWPN
jgi:methylglyoxal/glyoxal reductase